jgi:hypothetical protein
MPSIYASTSERVFEWIITSMPNLDHLRILNKGVGPWNRWREEDPDASPDLNDAKLRGAVLSGMDLSWARLSGANLKKADFANATCGFTIFADVDLEMVTGLKTVQHLGPSTIGIDTIYRSSGRIPESFLQAAGVPDTLITYIGSLVGQPIQSYSCFISHSTKDQEFADRLHADLQAAGVRSWFAPEDLAIGDRFRNKIDESIRVHDKLLIILSRNSIESRWVATELEAALEREDREKERSVLFPIRLDDSVNTHRLGLLPSAERGIWATSAIGEVTNPTRRPSSDYFVILRQKRKIIFYLVEDVSESFHPLQRQQLTSNASLRTASQCDHHLARASDGAEIPSFHGDVRN